MSRLRFTVVAIPINLVRRGLTPLSDYQLGQQKPRLQSAFAHDGTKCCIFIGELNSTWSYPQVAVTDFQAGFANATTAYWGSGWDVGYETSSFGTVSVTESNTDIGVHHSSISVGGTEVISSARNLTNIGTIASSGRHTITGGATGDILLKMGSSTQTQYVDLQMASNSGVGELFKNGTAFTSYGGASSFNVYNSNGLIAFHPSNTANVLQIDTTGLNVGANRTIRMNGTTVIDSSRNITSKNIIAQASTDGAVALRLQRATTSGRAQMTFENETGATAYWRLGLTGPGSDDFTFFDGTDNVLVLDRGTNQASFAKTIKSSSVDTANPTPSTDNAFFNGYGIIGNRGNFYVTNSNSSAGSNRRRWRTQRKRKAYDRKRKHYCSFCNLIVGNSSTASKIRTYWNDGTYLEVNGYGLQFARNASYIRPNNDNARIMYFGQTTQRWSQIQLHTSSLKMGGTQILDSSRLLTNVTGRLPDGTGTAPAYSFASDPNIGMFSGGADVLKFTTGGTNGLTINATDIVMLRDTSLLKTMQHYGDTNTYFRFTTDRIRLVAGGVTFIDAFETSTDYLRFPTRAVTIGNNTSPQACLTIEQNSTVTPASGGGTDNSTFLRLDNSNTTASASSIIVFNADDAGGNTRHGAAIQFKVEQLGQW